MILCLAILLVGPLNVKTNFATDKANFPLPLNDYMKGFVIWNGPCKLKSLFPKDPKENNKFFFLKILQKV